VAKTAHQKISKKTAKKSVARKVNPKSINKDLTANNFIEQLQKLQSKKELEKIQRYFKSGEGEYGNGDHFIGIQMGKVFALAKEFIQMPLDEVEKLLENAIHEVRVGAVSIMDFQARDKKTSDEQKKELFDLYIRRHDRINNWDLVDRSAPYVVGGYLSDKPRSILYKLAQSKNVWERRTSIVSTYFFIRQNDVKDTFQIAELLLNDQHDLIHKATGGWVREAGKRDKPRLITFLDKYAATMPRTMLRYMTERLDKKQKAYYMALKEKK
jgi:3-methyladenine DNA glycosylase AlkD